MRLKRLKLKNFRGYREELVLDLTTELTAFLGRNDAGKSTILEALEIFFNNETVKVDPGDLSKGADTNVIAITCIFDDLPAEVVVDEAYPTTLAEEFLTNPDGDIEIRKEYKVQASVGKPSIFLVANHPVGGELDNLHSLKMQDLKALGRRLGVEGNVQDERVASLWRRAVWDHAAELELGERVLPIGELGTDSKQIYSKIEALLPTFALFRSDRVSSDVDPEAKNPLQAAVKQAQKDLDDEIAALQKKVEQSVIEVADRTLEKIREMDPNLANELTPRFKEPPKWTFNFTLDSDDGIPMNKRGSGARRLILLNFFRAEAERKKHSTQSPRVIYAVEEPETSQHPNYQAMLIEALVRLSLRNDCQILLTTHVPALAGLLPIESIRFISKNDAGDPVITPVGEHALSQAASSLGVLPEPGIAGARAVLLVEGPGDVVFVRHSARELKRCGRLAATLEEKGIAVIPIGGCGNLKHWVTKQLVEQLGLGWSVLLDSDIGNEVESVRNRSKIEELRAEGRLAFLTRKREPENYIEPALVEEMYGAKVEYTDTCDAKKIIAAATKKRPEDVLERFWPMMSAERIVSRCTYVENGVERVEFAEILGEIIEAHATDDELESAV